MEFRSPCDEIVAEVNCKSVSCAAGIFVISPACVYVTCEFGVADVAYLKWNPDWGILYKKTGKRYGESWDIELYVDSDHAADMDHRRSRTGYIILVNGTNMIDFGTAMQPRTATSTPVSEYVAMDQTDI